MKKLIAVALFVAACSAPAGAEWTLDNDSSRLSFVSTKAGAAAEPHHFTRLEGKIDERGNLTITIDLESVDTAIEIRDERMREMLFETAKFPTATLAAAVDMNAVQSLEPGADMTMAAEGQLMLHGTTLSVTADLTLLKLAKGRLVAVSRKPIIVNAGQVGLLEGVERLREVAGLPSISPAVPVSFILAFDQDAG